MGFDIASSATLCKEQSLDPRKYQQATRSDGERLSSIGDGLFGNLACPSFSLSMERSNPSIGSLDVIAAMPALKEANDGPMDNEQEDD